MADNRLQKQCILCGRCLEVCPLFAATGREELSPKAKMFLAQSLAGDAAGRLAARPVAELAGLCLGCDRCRAACSQGLSTLDAVAALRAAHPGVRQWLWKMWITRADTLWPAAARLGGWAQLAGATKAPQKATTLRKLAALAGGESPSPWLRMLSFNSAPDAERPYALFPGCMAATVRPAWIEAALRMLAACGRTLAPAVAWACCGAALACAGVVDAAAAARLHNVAAWRQAGRPRLALFCDTCLHGLQAYATDTDIDWSADEAELWSASLRPLAAVWGTARFAFEPHAPVTVVYHQPCHGRAASGSLAWLQGALGSRLRAWTDAECCGLGGVLQLAAPELSAVVADRCFERLAPRPGEQILSSCSGCVVQLATFAPAGVSVAHWLDVLVFP